MESTLKTLKVNWQKSRSVLVLILIALRLTMTNNSANKHIGDFLANVRTVFDEWLD